VRGGDFLARLDATRFAVVVEGSAGRRKGLPGRGRRPGDPCSKTQPPP